MAPKTRMTPEQVALNAQKQRHLFEERTGIPLISEKDYAARKAFVTLASTVPRQIWEKIVRKPPTERA